MTGEQKKILLIEDNPGDVELVREALRDKDRGAVELVAAGSLEEAATALDAGMFDLIMLDLGLPGSSGFDTFEKLRNLEPDTPVIVFTGQDDHELATRCVQAGAQDFLVKGMRLFDLSFAVHNALAMIAREKNHRESEERYHRLFQNMSSAVAVYRAVEDGEDFVFVDLNPAGERYSRTQKESVIGKRVTAAFPGVVEMGMLSILQRVYRTGEPGFLPDTLYHDDRFSLWVDNRVFRLHGDLVVAIFDDVSDRYRARAELKESERRFREIFHGVFDGIALADVETGGFYLVNERMCEMTGYTEEELGRIAVKDLHPKDDLARVEDVFARQVRGEFAMAHDIPVLRKDGIVFLADVNSRPIELAGRQYLMGCFRDVTDRKQAEEALLKSEETFRTLVEASPDAILLCDPQALILAANRTTAALGGWEETELVDRSAFDLIEPVDHEKIADGLKEMFEKGSVHDVEMNIRRKDGSVFMGSVSTAMTGDPGEGPSNFVVVVRDMTERNRMQNQLSQSDRLASMGMLAAGVAHEINNPLAYVLYNLESLVKDFPKLSNDMRRCYASLVQIAGPEKIEEIVGTRGTLFHPAGFEDIVERAKDALEGSERIKEIARGLKTFSRVEESNVAEVDVHYAINCALSMAYNEIKYRARVVKDFGRISPVLANEGRISQVFLNLLINAAQAIEEGDADNNEIRLRTFEDSGEVVIEVSDTGKGIPAEIREHLFEPFFSTKEKGIGSGLGLAICRRIVEEYQGRIEAEGVAGRGTCFRVRIPAGRQAERPEDLRPKEPDLPIVRGRILVVDDEKGIRTTLRRMLGDTHEMVFAESGEAGQEILAGDRNFDLILCDLMMPKISGMDLYQWLQGNHPELVERVVFVTGGAFTPKAQQFRESVPNLQIDKPFDHEAMIELVNEKIREFKSGN